MNGEVSLRSNLKNKTFICENMECQILIEKWMNSIGGKLGEFEKVLKVLRVELPLKIILASANGEEGYLVCINLENIRKVYEIKIHADKKITLIVPEFTRTYNVKLQDGDVKLFFQD